MERGYILHIQAEYVSMLEQYIEHWELARAPLIQRNISHSVSMLFAFFLKSLQTLILSHFNWHQVYTTV